MDDVHKCVDASKVFVAAPRAPPSSSPPPAPVSCITTSTTCTWGNSITEPPRPFRAAIETELPTRDTYFHFSAARISETLNTTRRDTNIIYLSRTRPESSAQTNNIGFHRAPERRLRSVGLQGNKNFVARRLSRCPLPRTPHSASPSLHRFARSRHFTGLIPDVLRNVYDIVSHYR